MTENFSDQLKENQNFEQSTSFIDMKSFILENFFTAPLWPMWFKHLIIKVATKIVYQDKFNELINQFSDLDTPDFIDHSLKALNFKAIMSPTDLEKIPKTGGVLIVANHPSGFLDGLALINCVFKVRKDVKVVSNIIAASIPPLRPMILSFSLFGKKSYHELKSVKSVLKQGNAVIMFPAGNVSKLSLKGVRDLKWTQGFIKYALNSQVPILPIFIQGKNSLIFYVLSSLVHSFTLFLIPSQSLNRKSRSFKLHVLSLFTPNDIDQIPLSSLEEKAQWFQKKIYQIPRSHLEEKARWFQKKIYQMPRLRKNKRHLQE